MPVRSRVRKIVRCRGALEARVLEGNGLLSVGQPHVVVGVGIPEERV